MSRPPRSRRPPSPPASPKQKSSPQSPTSPVCRVAKRNARLLNGLDLSTGVSSYTEQLLGMIPDFTVRKIHEACPALQPALNSGLEIDGSIDNMLLGELQFQLEGLLGENLDYQRNIDGERTFLQTGDYPKVDFSCRAMPTYELRTGGRKVKRKTEPEEPQPSCSYAEPKDEEEDAGSDVVSSMDEEEPDEQPYCVLDIPHRFWTWAREYVGHVDAKFLRDFDENFFQKYQPENMAEFFVNEPFKHKAPAHPKSKAAAKQPAANRAVKEEQPAYLTQARKANGRFRVERRAPRFVVSPPPKRGRPPAAPKVPKREPVEPAPLPALPPPPALQPPEHAADLMKRLVAAYVEEKANVNGKKPPKRPTGRQEAEVAAD
ncbi:hypothetical protein M3Y99_00555600 [Aphelenchoides fujianensis]|nr:hypothetical protein M3Y99_00555600 [Aphelenchoides fujianensis]